MWYDNKNKYLSDWITNKYYATKISDSVRGLCVPDKGLGGYGMVNLRAHLG